MSAQDYKPVVLRKTKAVGTIVKAGPLAGGTARVGGTIIKLDKENITTLNRSSTNKAIERPGLSTFKKLDGDDTNEMKTVLLTVSKGLAQKISSARTATGLTRKKLAAAIYETEGTLSGIENSTSLYASTIIQKINRVLSTNFSKKDNV